MPAIKDIFRGESNGKVSSKRTTGICIIFIGVLLWLDSHYFGRTLNKQAFDTMMTTATVLLVGGVADKYFNKAKQDAPPAVDEDPEQYK